ncbi:MAG: tRNA lysidine(34) synthetase TilS [Halioglobus sp.]|nr:tRNA lysidine(34) synthetase TilS [Halioglobus sp.]
MLDDSLLDDTLRTLTGAARWYVGFSGGVDSTVLLQLLADWRARHPGAPPLAAIHVNHRLQSAADRWQAHCEDCCGRLAVPLTCLAVEVRESGEAGARQARYAAFERVLEPGDVLFLAHHLDDQVETFFLRLMRGAGVEGLAAMPAGRELGRGRLARPLLGVPRAAIEAFAARRGLEFVEDPTNADPGIDRNFLRREVLPLLQQRWPAYRTTVSRASAHLADAAQRLQRQAGQGTTIYAITGDPGLALAGLCAGNSADACTHLRQWLRERGLRPPAQSTLLEFVRQLRGARDGAAPRLQVGDYTLCRFREGVYLHPARDGAEPPAEVGIAPGQALSIPGVGGVSLVPASTRGISLGAGERLALRFRSDGQACRPAGRGGSTSLKKLLQECAVPPWWRDRVPLLYLDGELLAVAHLALCESSRLQTAGSPRDGLWTLRWEPAPGTQARLPD